VGTCPKFSVEVQRIVNAEMKKQYAPICGCYGIGASDRWPYHLLGAGIVLFGNVA
jgi:hypothetical protein